MIGAFIHKITKQLARKKRGTKLFEYLHFLALEGLNIGNPKPASFNGEMQVLKWINIHFDSVTRPVILDVGANKGDYTAMLLECIHNCKVHAFEPLPTVFHQLQHRFDGHLQVQVNPILVSNQIGSHTFYQRHDHSELSSVYNRYIGNASSNQSAITVNSITIDAYCADNNIDEIQLLKIDAEGHDLFVLQGAKQMLANKKIHCIQFEFGGSNIDSRTYMRDFFDLLSNDFHISRIMEDGLAPLSQYHETLEIFSTANYFAQLKQS